MVTRVHNLTARRLAGLGVIGLTFVTAVAGIGAAFASSSNAPRVGRALPDSRPAAQVGSQLDLPNAADDAALKAWLHGRTSPPGVSIGGHALNDVVLAASFRRAYVAWRKAEPSAAFDPSSPAFLRSALAQAAFSYEVQQAGQALRNDREVVAAARALVADQRAAMRDATAADLVRLRAAAGGHALADPADPKVAKRYARMVAAQVWLSRNLTTAGRLDIRKARRWLAARVAADHVRVHGVTVPSGHSLADYLLAT
jgi:hypothetical protein